MPDAMDHVQQHAADHAADSVARHVDRVKQVGRHTCANLDCGEPISDTRRALGAQLCIECAQAEEAMAAHQRVWRGR